MKRVANWRRTLLKTLLAVAFLFMLFRWFEHNQVYHPTRQLEASPADLGRPHENVFFETSDHVKLNAWFFPTTNSPRSRFAVLLCHGNGGNISHRLDVCEALLETGVGVFAFDYRGYGASEGRPSEAGTYRDCHAAYDWLLRRGFAPENIIVYGESLGGGIASELCASKPTGGLILQSTFTSIPEIGSELFPWLPVRLVGSIKYDTRSRLPKLTIPVLVLHSRDDDLIGYRHSELNFAAANEPKLCCELKGDHNDPLADRKGFVEAIERFLQLVESHHAVPQVSR
jgi:uncharacterized protein